MLNPTILIVDDEAPIRRFIGDALSHAGYCVEQASSGSAALKRLQQPGIDLLLLDLQLGDLDGIVVMQAAREYWPRLPIIMLTAHGSLSSAIAAVRCNATDYLLKPIGIDELRSCIAGALARHSDKQSRDRQLREVFSQMQHLLQCEGLLGSVSPLPAPPKLQIVEGGPLRMDLNRHTVTMEGQAIEVTPSEFVILQALLSQPGAVVSCSDLVRELSIPIDDEEEARQLIRPHIVRLRRKLERDPGQPAYLLSVRSLGYRWAGE